MNRKMIRRIFSGIPAALFALSAAPRAESGKDSLPSIQSDGEHEETMAIPTAPPEYGGRPDITRICMCMRGRLAIRKSEAYFVPVTWELRRPDGSLVPLPQGSSSGTETVFDLNGQRKGVYIVVVTDKAGNRMSRPIRID